jgi:hypothetical protein
VFADGSWLYKEDDDVFDFCGCDSLSDNCIALAKSSSSLRAAAAADVVGARDMVVVEPSG